MFKYLSNMYPIEQSALDFVVHIGAGKCPELGVYQQLKAKTIALYEADNQLVQHLLHKTQYQHNVSVKHAQITADSSSKKCRFNVANNPRYSSTLLPATTLHNHLPNIEMTGQEQENVQSLCDVLKSIDLRSTGNNLLAIETQGTEDILISSVNDNLLQKFSRICISTSEETLYEGGATRKQIVTAMQNKGFELYFVDREQLPFIHLYFNRNVMDKKEFERQAELISTLEIDSLAFKNQSEQLMSVQQDNQTLIDGNEAKEAQIAALKKELLSAQEVKSNAEDQLTAMKVQCQTLSDDAKKQEVLIGEVTEQRNKQTEWHQANKKWAEGLKVQLKTEKNKTANLASQNAKLVKNMSTNDAEKKQISDINVQLGREKDEWHKREIEYKKQTGTLTNELSSLKTRVKTLDNELVQKSKENAADHKMLQSVQSQLKTLNTKLNERTRSADLGQKLLAKAQLDLDALRQSYKEKSENKAVLVELVKELREKLQVASTYYFRLQEKYAELTNHDTQDSGRNE